MSQRRSSVIQGNITRVALPIGTDPYLVFRVVDRNMVPNSMSAPISSVEMATGQKINYRTDILQTTRPYSSQEQYG